MPPKAKHTAAAAAAGDGTTEPVAGATGDGTAIPEGTTGTGDGLAAPAGAEDGSEPEPVTPPEGAAAEPQPTGGQPVEDAEGQHGVAADGSFRFSQRKAPIGPAFKVGEPLTAEHFAALVGMQSHTAVLEGVVEDNRVAARKDYVASLVTGDRPKLLAAQQAATESLVLGFSDDQYSAWKAVQDASPPLGLLQSHGDGTSNHNGDQSGRDSSQVEEKDTLLGILKHHKDGGMKADKIKTLASYRRMLEIDPSFKL